jgi:hypothetical protein
MWHSIADGIVFRNYVWRYARAQVQGTEQGCWKALLIPDVLEQLVPLIPTFCILANHFPVLARVASTGIFDGSSLTR